ncbi:outer membrane lipid asymmetry maintenance protein MlaD [Wielerella bovis]|uniref:outer membrane lipid asymmetry maintenance protein MlaD n=1 Tax=Wielerella bovis TaxID=2917790 RepID=UPI002019E9D5|nr:outer membrane lipid asymmetry maintenance protein MlaD [Wielerella bovis]ULJ62934.1 outer membrane lipid asymmetry maintenance protein MlaD [Wielerella bovis]
MKKSVLEFWVGVFVLLGFLALGALSFKVAGNKGGFGSSTQTYTVYAEFEDIGGLKVQAPIKTAGVLVGRVSSIQLDPQNFQAKVSMELDKQYPFSVDASAAILTSGLLGEQYIGLTNGGDEAKLQHGDTLSLTTSAMVLENLINKFVSNFMSKDTPESE